jgi:hypothetical protein
MENATTGNIEEQQTFLLAVVVVVFVDAGADASTIEEPQESADG